MPREETDDVADHKHNANMTRRFDETKYRPDQQNENANATPHLDQTKDNPLQTQDH